MKEKIENFANKHTLIYCVIMEIVGLGGLFLVSFLLQLAQFTLFEMDYYVLFFLQEAIGAVIMFLLMKLSGVEDVLRRRGIGFGRGLLVGMYFLVISVYSLAGTVALYEGERILRPWYLILAYLLCMMFVGVTEEILCRGIIAELLSRHFGATRVGVWKAVVVSGILFGCAHFTNLIGGEPTGVFVQAVIASFMGMTFAAIYFRSGCIWVTIFLHGFVDIAGTIVTGIYVGNETVADVISSYQLWQLVGCIPYIIVLLVLLRGSKMNEIVQRMRGEMRSRERIDVHGEMDEYGEW